MEGNLFFFSIRHNQREMYLQWCVQLHQKALFVIH